MAQWGVLANAVINVVGNLSGWRSAMRETQTQLWGMLTLSNRIGGLMAQNLITPIAAHMGMAAIHRAQQTGKLAYQHAMQQWQAQKPPRPQMPPSVLALTNPALYAQLMAQYQQRMAAFPAAMAAWRQARPNQQQIMAQFVQSAGQAAGYFAMASAAVIGLGRVLVNAAHYASDFREELNKLTQTFGMSTGSVMRQINELGGSGINRTDMMRGVGTMGIELLGSGMSEKIATDLAMRLGQRALDVSSLYNIDQEAALTKFKSGLAGFGRPLKELGIVIDEDRIRTEAFTSGLWDGHSALTDEVKMQARANVILRETERAAGDYARTSGELANQYRALSGNFTNLMSTLGNTGIVTGFTAALNIAMVKMTEFTVAIQAWWQKKFSNHWSFFMSGVSASAADAQQRNIQEQQASLRNLGMQSRAYADAVIGDVFLGKGRSASHMGIADAHKRIQEGIFNDKGRVQIDLTRKLVDLTQEQVNLMKQVGFTHFINFTTPIPGK